MFSTLDRIAILMMFFKRIFPLKSTTTVAILVYRKKILQPDLGAVDLDHDGAPPSPGHLETQSWYKTFLLRSDYNIYTGSDI